MLKGPDKKFNIVRVRDSGYSRQRMSSVFKSLIEQPNLCNLNQNLVNFQQPSNSWLRVKKDIKKAEAYL